MVTVFFGYVKVIIDVESFVRLMEYIYPALCIPTVTTSPTYGRQHYPDRSKQVVSYQVLIAYYCMAVRLAHSLNNWRNNLNDGIQECCELLLGCTGPKMSPVKTSIRSCPSWARTSWEKDCSLQGTAREEMMSLSLGSYYGNLDMDSNREDVDSLGRRLHISPSLSYIILTLLLDNHCTVG